MSEQSESRHRVRVSKMRVGRGKVCRVRAGVVGVAE